MRIIFLILNKLVSRSLFRMFIISKVYKEIDSYNTKYSDQENELKL